MSRLWLLTARACVALFLIAACLSAAKNRTVCGPVTFLGSSSGCIAVHAPFTGDGGYRELAYSAEVTAVPEPGAALLLFTAMIVVFSSRRLHLRGNQTGGIK